MAAAAAMIGRPHRGGQLESLGGRELQTVVAGLPLAAIDLSKPLAC